MAQTVRTEGLIGYTVQGTDGMVFRDLSDLVMMIGQTEAPFFDRVSSNGLGETPIAKKVEWTDDRHHRRSFVESSLSSTDGTSLVLSAYGSDVYEGSVLEHDGEQVLVTAISSNTLTVVRGYAGTSATTHAGSSVWQLVSVASYDNQEFGLDRSLVRTAKSNWVQHFVLPVEVDDVTNALKTVGAKGQEYDYQVKKVLTDAIVILDRAMLRGKKLGSSPEGTSTTPATMDGIKNMISTNATALSSARLQSTHIKSSLETCYATYGGRPDLLIGNIFNVGLIDAWLEGRKTFSAGDTTFSPGVVNQWSSRYGKVDIMLDPNCPDDEVYLVESDKIILRPLMTFREVPKPSTSTSKKGIVQGMYTLELRCESRMAKITGTATS